MSILSLLTLMQTSKSEMHCEADFIENFILLFLKLNKLKKSKEELSLLKQQNNHL